MQIVRLLRLGKDEGGGCKLPRQQVAPAIRPYRQYELS